MHTTGKIVVKKRDDVDDLLRYSVLLEYFPQAGSVDAVKVYIDIPLPLIALLQNIPKCKYVLSGSSPWSKPCLFLMRIMTTLQNTLLGIESNVTPLQLLQSARLPFLVFGQCFPVPFPWKLLLFPYVNEQRLENVTVKLGVNFKKLCRNRILAWRLVVLQGLNGIKNSLSSWWVYPHV